jgi:copper(I)-binding protein
MKTASFALAFSLVAAGAAATQIRPEVAKPWSRPAAAGSTGVGYMVLTNHGAAPDALVAVSSPLATGTMIHKSTISGGMASMRMVGRVDLPPGRAVTFGPGGYHLMFEGLKKPLKPGDALPATLTFASGAKVQARFAVRVSPP